MEDKPIKHGHLLTPPQGKLLKRTWQKKYYALYKASNYAVERVEVFDSEEGFQQNSSIKIIPLNDCVKVAQSPQKAQQNVFDVITKTQVYQFSTETAQDLADWVSAFQMVAFGGGGQRSSASTGSYGAHVYRASVNAEEENQIYSSYSGHESYLVKIVDTDASISCCLNGDYLLVVSALQLLLYEKGANPNGSNYLYAWPYRHIRRYGRNKGLFTFEAGRKCASGAGTFTLATSDSNSIFMSVQTYTRALKREEEDAAHHTSGVILNKLTSSKSPSEEDSGPKSHFLNESSRHASPATGDTDNSKAMVVPDAKDNNNSILSRVLSRNKVQAPFSKPPRKSKNPPVTPSLEKPSLEPVRFEISPAARAKLAESTSTSNVPKFNIEPMYAVPEVRTEAWKTFGMESDNIHVEKLLPVTENYYNIISVSPTTPSTTSLPWLPNPSDKPKILAPLKRAQSDTSSCYDHLSPFGQQSPKSSTSFSFTDGHIYSRLISVNDKVSNENQSCSSDPSAAEAPQESAPVESGVPSSTSSVTSDALKTSEDEVIQRFTQNEDVYTVIAKPVRKVAKPTDL